MRTAIGLLALAGGLAWPSVAAAQNSVIGGMTPANLIQKPIDTSHTIVPMPALGAQQQRFNFSSIFSKFMLPTYPSQRGLSPMPVPSSFPSMHYNPFKMLGKPPILIGDPKKTAMPINVPTPFIPSVNSPVGPGSG